MLKVLETTYLERASAAQPCGNALNHVHRVHRPRHQRGHIKTEPKNVNQTLEIEETHLRHVNTIRSMWRPRKGVKRFNKLTFKYRKPGEPWHDVEDHG